MTSSFTEADVEAAVQAKGLTAPRVTSADIDSLVERSAADYHVFPGTTVTVCCLTLPFGYSVIGHSAAISAANFDEEIGRRVALAAARDQLWQLEGYRRLEAIARGYGEAL